MKTRIIFILALLFVLFQSCKTFEGNYSTLPNYQSYGYTFMKTGEFSANYMGDQGGFSGMNYGTYRFKKDTLILKYAPIPDKHKIPSKNRFSIKRKDSKGDSSYFKIRAFDTKSKAPFLFSLTPNFFCDEFKGWKNRVGEGGKLDFLVANKNIPIVFTLERYDPIKIEIPIEKPGDYSIQIFLSKWPDPVYDYHPARVTKFLKRKKDGITYFKHIGGVAMFDIYELEYALKN